MHGQQNIKKKSEKVSYKRVNGKGKTWIDFALICLYYLSSLTCPGPFLFPIPNSGLPILLFSMTHLPLLSCITHLYSNVAHFHPEDGDSSRFLGFSKTLVTSYQATHWHNPRDHI